MNKCNLDINLLDETEIIELYETYVKKPKEYFKKANDEYHKLSDFEKSKWFSKDFPRLASIFEFKEWIQKYNLQHVGKLLSTCSNDFELEYVTYDNIIFCEYFSDKKYDLHTLNLNEKEYDFVIFNQTLEHLYNPFIGMKNLYNHLKIGGYLYTTVPTINIPHEIPFHFWGITPTGLCALGKSIGFNVLECGYWGNLSYINHIFNHNNWPNTNDIMINNTIENIENCQSQTWALFQK